MDASERFEPNFVTEILFEFALLVLFFPWTSTYFFESFSSVIFTYLRGFLTDLSSKESLMPTRQIFMYRTETEDAYVFVMSKLTAVYTRVV